MNEMVPQRRNAPSEVSRASFHPIPRPLVQRRCACGGKIETGGGCAACRKKGQRASLDRAATALLEPPHRFAEINVHRPAGMRISQPNDTAEKEAVRLADSAMDGRAGQLVRQVPNETGSMTAPPTFIDRVLRSGGQPLETHARGLMESRFGHDFSRVRIHSGAAAEQSARALEARAYTTGDHIVFGKDQFALGSREGQRLLAHELVHTLQQRGAPPQLQRACLAPSECTAPRSTLSDFVAETEKKPENISKADKRKKACGKTPPDPSCTGDGHGAKATACTKLMETNYKSRLGHITGFFVNKDMPADWGAVTHPCASFVPPIAGGTCTSVPDRLEAEARNYESGNKTIGGWSRADWLTIALGTLTHETEHGRYDSAAPIAELTPTACKFADHEANLSEMAARMSEMHVWYRDALSRPEKNRFQRFYAEFPRWVTNSKENIRDTVKDLGCKCECADANHYITKTAESVSNSQKWDTNELSMVHTELRDPKWGMKPPWPVAPPSSINVNDLPDIKPVPFKLE